MAFVSQNEETPATQAPANQQAPIAAGGQGVGGASKAASTPGVNVPAQPSAQLSAYLSANQPQAAAFGQNVAGQVAGQINAAGQAIQPAVNTYTGNLYSVAPDASVNAAVASSPSSLTDAQKATYKTELGAAGAAPNSASTFETTSGYQDAAGKIQSAVDQASLWNSGNNPSNISAALAPYEGPNATQGVRTLDSLLLSRTPDAYSKIQAAVAPAAGFQDQLAAGTKSADDALLAAINQDQATTPAAQASAQQYVGGLNSTLADYLTQAQNDVNTYNGQINGISSQEATLQPDIAALQNAIASYNSLLQYGQPGPASLLTPIDYTAPGALPSQAAMPSISQVATPQNYADLSALSDLLGPGAFAALNPSVTPGQAGQAGTYTKPVANVGQSIGEMLAATIGGANSGLVSNEDVFNKYGDISIEPQNSGTSSSGAGPSGDALVGGAVTPFVDPFQDTNIIGSLIGGGGGTYTPVTYSAKSAYSAVQNALKALIGQEQQISPSATPPLGAVPGSPEYNAWLQQQYPGLSPVNFAPPAVDSSGNVIHTAI